MHFEVTGITDIGCKREHNEDFFLADESLGLFAVADGMGGLLNGEEASRLAVETLLSRIRAAAVLETLETLEPEVLLRHLKGAVVAANEAITERNRQGAAMGTTLTALWLVGGKGLMVHVGDSRLYLHREDKLVQLTSDHTLVESLKRSGWIQPGETRNHPMSHVLLNSLGNGEALQIDTAIFDTGVGDAFLLCTDGLNAHITDEEIAAAFPEADLSLMGLDMLKMARRRGGRDNITFTLVRIEPESHAASWGRIKGFFETALSWAG